MRTASADVPVYGDDARKAAETFREENGLGIPPIADIVALIEQTQDVDVTVLGVDDSKEHGLTIVDPVRGATIVAVASSNNPMRWRSTLSGWSSSSATTKLSRRSRHESAGSVAAAFPPSSTCNAASSNTRPRSLPRSSTDWPTDASNRSTPRSDSSPASRSASSHQTALIALVMLNLGGHRPVLPGGK